MVAAVRMQMTPEARVAAIDKAVTLTDDQKTKITAIYTADAKKMQDLMAAQDPDMRTKMTAMRTDENTSIKALLTDDQKPKFDAYLAAQPQRGGRGGGGAGGAAPPHLLLRTNRIEQRIRSKRPGRFSNPRPSCVGGPPVGAATGTMEGVTMPAFVAMELYVGVAKRARRPVAQGQLQRRPAAQNFKG